MRNAESLVAVCFAFAALVSGENHVLNSDAMTPAPTTPPKTTATTTSAPTTPPKITATTTSAPTTPPKTTATTTSAPTTPPKTTATTTSAPTTPPKTTMPTTPAHNTTTSAPTTPPKTTVPTTPAHNATTSAPTTPPKTTVPTTPAHNTTSSHTTAPLVPTPTPPANLSAGIYNASDPDGKLCVLAAFALEIRVQRSTVNGTFVLQPDKVNVTGSCEEKMARLILSFSEGGIALKFRNDTTAVYIEALSVDVSYAFSAGVTPNVSQKNQSLQLFSAAPGHSFSCSALSVYMGEGVTLDFTRSRVQAFNFRSDDFGLPDLCRADQPSYRIPIAVGIVLIILILIVVIAYLVSRKRRMDGYQTL